jgi:hypothetical protein
MEVYEFQAKSIEKGRSGRVSRSLFTWQKPIPVPPPVISNVFPDIFIDSSPFKSSECVPSFRGLIFLDPVWKYGASDGLDHQRFVLTPQELDQLCLMVFQRLF